MMQPENDPFDLARFVAAQQDSFDQAVVELKNGQKSSHWMWYIFPQLRGLGRSPTAQRYGISGEKEARAYINHEILGKRLLHVSELVVAIEGRTASSIFGRPDDIKLRSCATLFAFLSEKGSVFHMILKKYFDDRSDPQTLRMLGL